MLDHIEPESQRKHVDITLQCYSNVVTERVSKAVEKKLETDKRNKNRYL